MKKINKLSIILISLGFIIIIIFYALKNYAYKNKPVKLIEKAITVEIAQVSQKNVPYNIELAGLAEASEEVEVKSLIGGQIVKVHCSEGQDVKINDLLFEIDARNFLYQLEQAESNLIKDKAQLENAEKEATRYEALFKEQAASEEQCQQTQANLKILQAAIIADEAIIKNAKLQLEYSKIISPINGKLGEIMLDQGNIINTNSTTFLVSIKKISPIYVTLFLPQQHIELIRNFQNSKDLTIKFINSSGKEIECGQIVFIDNPVDTNSGTIKLKTLFANSEEDLWPGQFVRMFLKIYNNKNAIVIPSKALQLNQNGDFVFVVNKNNIVEIRNIKIDQVNDDYAIVSEGLEIGENIVITGQLRLANGSLVKSVHNKGG